MRAEEAPAGGYSARSPGRAVASATTTKAAAMIASARPIRLASLRIRSAHSFEPLQRLDNLLFARLGLFALFLFLFDHLFRRARDEIRVAELGVDAGNVSLGLCDLLLEARALGRNVDQSSQRQADCLPANHDLHGSGLKCRRPGNFGNSRHSFQEFRPAL